MRRQRWRMAAVAAVICGVVTVPFLPYAAADTTVPDGGGWAGSGAAAVPGAVRAAGTAAPAGYGVRGIDVSSHDHSVHDINWPAVATSGVTFAYIKATEGTTYANPYYGSDYTAARNAGLYVGAYAYGRPDLGNPVGQADFLVSQSLWGPDSRTLVPFLDMEWPYAAVHRPACWGLTPAQMSAWIHAFVDRVAARIGRVPMIYTNSYWWNPCTGNDASFGAYPLDISGYTSGPPRLAAGWSTFAIWQYAAGNNGVAGNYDRDVINGDVAALAALGGATPPTVVGLLAHANGQIVSAESAGTRPLVANRRRIGIWEQFDEIDLNNGYIALRSHANGRYVTAERAGAAPLIANRMVIGGWEQFQLVHNADGSVSLRARVNGRYVTVDPGGGAQPIASRTGIGPWERFDAVPPPRVVSLRARVNGRYVTAERAGAAPLIANRTRIGLWERFELMTLGGGRVALRALADGEFVCAERAGTAPLIANRSGVGGWETFSVVQNGDGSVSLRARTNGRFVTAENRGGSPLIANRTAIGGWEEFDLV